MNETNNVHGTENITFHCPLISFFLKGKIYRPIYSQLWLCPALGPVVNKLMMTMMMMMIMMRNSYYITAQMRVLCTLLSYQQLKFVGVVIFGRLSPLAP